MKTRIKELKESSLNMTRGELYNVVLELTKEIITTDDRMLSVGKSWSGYGTWKSSGFANTAYFGNELAEILRKTLSLKITHDEEKVFEIEEFEEDIFEAIYSAVS